MSNENTGEEITYYVSMRGVYRVLLEQIEKATPEMIDNIAGGMVYFWKGEGHYPNNYDIRVYRALLGHPDLGQALAGTLTVALLKLLGESEEPQLEDLDRQVEHEQQEGGI